MQESPALVLGTLVLLLVVMAVGVLVWLAATMAGIGHGSPSGWVAARDGRARWSTGASVWLAALVTVFVVFIVVPAVVLVRGVLKDRQWTDSRAASMSSRRDQAEMTEKAVTADSKRLGVAGDAKGVPLGRSVLDKSWLYATYEWSQVWIMGTRAGKSRSVIIPMAMSHPGPRVLTANKRADVHDRLVGPLSERGTVWVNDPQRIAKREAEWWWSPLTFVTSPERAERLVDVWAASRTSQDMKGADPYFEPTGRRVSAVLLIAARLGGEPITRLNDWLSGKRPEPGVPDPAAILRAGGYAGMASEMESWWALDQGQRDGVFGTAASNFGFLNYPSFLRWMQPSGPEDERPEFDPAAFVRSEQDTLVLLSKEGAGSARALTGALTLAVYSAAEDYGDENGGRCPRPIAFLLDEAPNVCRWPELPNLYSHAGSRGIILVVVLQTPAQGPATWGEAFNTMWSSANITVVGRGVNDEKHLSALSRLIGTRQRREVSTSHGTKGGRSTSVQTRDEAIFTEADLRAFPRGRAILMASGARAILLELRDYSTYEWAPAVEASLAHYGQVVSEDVDELRPLSEQELTRGRGGSTTRVLDAGSVSGQSGRAGTLPGQVGEPDGEGGATASASSAVPGAMDLAELSRQMVERGRGSSR